jgi:hypothetical protein
MGRLFLEKEKKEGRAEPVARVYNLSYSGGKGSRIMARG